MSETIVLDNIDTTSQGREFQDCPVGKINNQQGNGLWTLSIRLKSDENDKIFRIYFSSSKYVIDCSRGEDLKDTAQNW